MFLHKKCMAIFLFFAVSAVAFRPQDSRRFAARDTPLARETPFPDFAPSGGARRLMKKQTKGGLVDQPGKNPVFTKMAQDATAGSGDGSKIRVPIGNIKKIEGPIGVLKTNAQSLIKRTSLSPQSGLRFASYQSLEISSSRQTTTEKTMSVKDLSMERFMWDQREEVEKVEITNGSFSMDRSQWGQYQFLLTQKAKEEFDKSTRPKLKKLAGGSSSLFAERRARSISISTEVDDGKGGVRRAQSFADLGTIMKEKTNFRTPEMKMNWAAFNDLLRICDVEEVQVLLTPMKEVTTQSQEVELPITVTHSYLDRVIYLNAIESTGEIDETFESIKAEVRLHATYIKAFLSQLETIRDTDLHFYGSNFVILRGQLMISQLGGLFNLNPTDFPTPSVPKATSGYQLWFETLTNSPLNDHTIDDFYDIFTRNQAVFSAQGQFQYSLLGPLSLDKKFGAPQKAFWDKYFGEYEKLRLQLCRLAYALVKLYTTTNSYDYILSKQPPTSQTATSNNMVLNGHAKNFLQRFQDLLVRAPEKIANEKCGKERDLREIMHVQFLGRSLYQDTFIQQSTKFFSSQFFRYIRTALDRPNFQEIVDFDFMFVREEYTLLRLSHFTRMLQVHVDSGVDFHPEFFNDLFLLRVREVNGKGETQEKQIDLTSQDFTDFLLQIRPGDQDGDDRHLNFHYFKMIEVLYKLYLAVRNVKSFTVLKSTGSNGAEVLKSIYQAIYALITDLKYQADFINYVDFNEFKTVRYSVLTYVCLKLDKEGGQCGEKELKQNIDLVVEPDLIPPEPRPTLKLRIFILKILAILRKQKEEEKRLKDFEEKWLKIDWSKHTCKPIPRRRFFSTVASNTERKGGLSTQTTTTTEKFFRLNEKCTLEIFQTVHELIKTTLTMYDKEAEDINNFIRVLITLLKDDTKPRELIRYIVLRIVRFYVDNPGTKPPGNFKTLIIGLFWEFEKDFLDKIDYTKTAGLWGFFAALYRPGRSYSQDIGDYYMDSVHVKSGMAVFDLYYLAYVASFRTDVASLPPLLADKFGFNTRIMRTSISEVLEHLNKKPEFNEENYPQVVVLDREVQACRPKRFKVTSPEGNTVFVGEGECVRRMELGVEPCQEALPHPTKCDQDLVLRLTMYLLTADILLRSVSVFDNFNYFSELLMIDEVGKAEGAGGPKYKDISVLTFFRAVYVHLQDLRISLDSDYEDIPNYALNRIVNCLDIAGGRLEVLKDQMSLRDCPLDFASYGAMFWVLRHAFYLSYGVEQVSLGGWDDNTPMGTTPFVSLLVLIPRYGDTLAKMCGQVSSNIPEQPEICQEVWLVREWLEMAKDDTEINPDAGLRVFQSVFDLEATMSILLDQNAKNQKTKVYTDARVRFMRVRMVILEAYHASFDIFARDTRQLGLIKESINYYSADNGEQFQSLRIFEFSDDFNVEEIDYLATYYRFTFHRTLITEEEENLKNIVQQIFAATSATKTPVWKSSVKFSFKDGSLLCRFMNLNGNLYHQAVYSAAMFASSREHYKLLVAELRNLGVFLDSMALDFRYDEFLSLLTSSKLTYETLVDRLLNNKLEELTVIFTNLEESDARPENSMQIFGMSIEDFSYEKAAFTFNDDSGKLGSAKLNVRSVSKLVDESGEFVREETSEWTEEVHIESYEEHFTEELVTEIIGDAEEQFEENIIIEENETVIEEYEIFSVEEGRRLTHKSVFSQPSDVDRVRRLSQKNSEKTTKNIKKKDAADTTLPEKKQPVPKVPIDVKSKGTSDGKGATKPAKGADKKAAGQSKFRPPRDLFSTSQLQQGKSIVDKNSCTRKVIQDFREPGRNLKASGRQKAATSSAIMTLTKLLSVQLNYRQNFPVRSLVSEQGAMKKYNEVQNLLIVEKMIRPDEFKTMFTKANAETYLGISSSKNSGVKSSKNTDDLLSKNRFLVGSDSTSHRAGKKVLV